MLHATASPEPRTLAAPFTPQSHGVGRGSTAIANRMPVGNPKPINSPAGAMTAMVASARTSVPLNSRRESATSGSQWDRARR